MKGISDSEVFQTAVCGILQIAVVYFCQMAVSLLPRKLILSMPKPASSWFTDPSRLNRLTTTLARTNQERKWGR